MQSKQALSFVSLRARDVPRIRFYSDSNRKSGHQSSTSSLQLTMASEVVIHNYCNVTGCVRKMRMFGKEEKYKKVMRKMGDATARLLNGFVHLYPLRKN